MGVAVSGCGYNKRVHHWLGNCRDDALSSIQECAAKSIHPVSQIAGHKWEVKATFLQG